MNDIKAIVAELEKLDSVATPAPWPHDYCQGAVRHISKNVDQDAFYDGSFDGWSRYNDGPLIAAARNALPALLAELKRLWAVEQEHEELREVVLGLGEVQWSGLHYIVGSSLGHAKAWNALVAKLRAETTKETEP